jgi:epoxide hydrolase-like predicted phosphatase
MASVRTALIVDYGGVLTTDVFASFNRFCAAEGLAPETVRERFLHHPEARSLLEQLETGKLREADFEPRFAAVLEVEPERLIDRLFGSMEPDHAMLDGVRAARRAGIRTGMLSNSWGDDRYDVAQLEELFDGWVISAHVGMRKPDPAIYPLAAERIGVAPEQCVYVDDLPGNLKPARAIGMATVVHRGDAAQTLAEAGEHLGVSLR